MDRMEAIQHDFLNARRRWNAGMEISSCWRFAQCGTAAYGGILRLVERQYQPEEPRLFALSQGPCRKQ